MRYRGSEEDSPSHLDGSFSRRGATSLDRRLARRSSDGSDDDSRLENSPNRRTSAGLAGRSFKISATGDLGDGLSGRDDPLARNVSPTLAKRASQPQRFPYSRNGEDRMDSSLSRRTSPIPASRSPQRFPSDGYEGITRQDTSLSRRSTPVLAGRPSQRLSYTLDDDGPTRLDGSLNRRVNLTSQKPHDSEDEDFRARPGSSLSRRSASTAGKALRRSPSRDEDRIARVDSSLIRRPSVSQTGRSSRLASPSESDDGELERDAVRRGWKNYETNVRDNMYLKQRGNNLQKSPVQAPIPLGYSERGEELF